jgi:HEAT repeat protein
MKKLLAAAATFLCLVVSVQAADVEDLVKQLTDKDPDLRRRAAKELANAGTDAKPAVPVLVAALKDSDLFVRRFSAQALGAIGEDAQAAMPALQKMVKDANEKKEVQEAAVTAIGKMGKGSVKYLGGLVKDLEYDVTLRRRAAEALGAIGPDAKDALPALTDAVKGVVPKGKKLDKDSDIRLEAAEALGNIATADDADVLNALKAINADKGAKRNKTLFDTINSAVKKIEARK